MTAPPNAVQFPGARYVAPGPIRIMWYGNGRVALAIEHPDGFSRLSVNLLDSVSMEPDEIAIKNYSENEGVLAALVTAGLVAPPHRTVQQGHVSFPIVRPLGELATAISRERGR